MTLERYLRHRRAYEVGLFALMFAINFVAQVNVVWMDLDKAGLDIPYWQPVVWEISSTAAMAVMLAVLLWFDRYFPLERGNARRGVLGHMLFTIPWSLGHVGLMVLLRKLAYLYAGTPYDFGDLFQELVYEYLKDFRAYWGFVALIYLYRHILRRRRARRSSWRRAARTRRRRSNRSRTASWSRSWDASSWSRSRTSTGSRRPATTSTCGSVRAPIRCARRWPASRRAWPGLGSRACTVRRSSTSTGLPRSCRSTPATAKSA